MARLLFLVLCALSMLTSAAWAETLSQDALAEHVPPPFKLGEPANDRGVWTILNAGGGHAGYIFETERLTPLPGFSGAPINVLVTLDLEGSFIEARLIDHNEPIFVSGLGQAPFHAFFEQYRGHSLADTMAIGTPYGGREGASSLVYLDGVTKATASVRIAHESIMGAALNVAKEKMQGVAAGPGAYPDPEIDETLTWADLVAEGYAVQTRVTNGEVDALFADTLWEDDDPEASAAPDALYLDLWVVDLGPKSIARAALSPDSFAELQDFLAISSHDEPILLIETARHGLVSDGFIRNTSPDWLSARQDGFPVPLRDADLLVETAAEVPKGRAMILRTDRRLGFDPSRPWTLEIKALRSHGMFRPEIGSVTLEADYAADPRFFRVPEVHVPAPPWVEALKGRQGDLVLLAAFLVALGGALAFGMNRFAALRWFTPVRLTVLGVTAVFIGWWGQGQLSIVTPLAALAACLSGGSLAFLLYDPFSLLIWGVTIISFIAWGRGFFCGWLCPFGALQEFVHWLGRALRVPKIEPSALWDARLRPLKYALLAGLIGTAFFAPDEIDVVAEVEPFKTAITVFFVREWYFVLYAVFWLFLSMTLFKGFCRYVCPLGALMAVGGLLRGRDWIARREACGSPCQLCRVKCAYGAIKPSGEIKYSECFQCLDCVTIHDDPAQCVPLILAAKAKKRADLASAS